MIPKLLASAIQIFHIYFQKVVFFSRESLCGKLRRKPTGAKAENPSRGLHVSPSAVSLG
jgi:hypothetical protein